MAQNAKQRNEMKTEYNKMNNLNEDQLHTLDLACIDARTYCSEQVRRGTTTNRVEHVDYWQRALDNANNAQKIVNQLRVKQV